MNAPLWVTEVCGGGNNRINSAHDALNNAGVRAIDWYVQL